MDHIKERSREMEDKVRYFSSVLLISRLRIFYNYCRTLILRFRNPLKFSAWLKKKVFLKEREGGWQGSKEGREGRRRESGKEGR